MYCDYVTVAESEPCCFESSEAPKPEAQTYYQAYTKGGSAYVWNKIYSAATIKENGLGFCESEPIFEDVDFNLKYLQFCDDCIFLPQKLYGYVQRQDSIMHRYNPDWFFMHLLPFYGRVPFIGDENLEVYCDTWLYQFLNLFPNIFDERNKASWSKKIAYNQRMLSSKEFQFCLHHASGRNENPLVLKILKTRCYLLYWLFEKVVSIRHKK